jgi:hypothetical protein
VNFDKIIHNFDFSAQGAWYPLTLSIILLLFVLFMPKKLSWWEIYITSGVVGWMSTFIDLMLAANLDWFDLGKPQHEGLVDVISYTIIPPLFAVIYLNYFRDGKKWIYVIVFTLLSLLAHWGMVKVGFMKEKHWKFWWDTPIFLLVYGFYLPWLYRQFKLRAIKTKD